ncbi:LLM class flavin-dependent oxidoreductase [Microbacterium sp.]|uniref:LLM class flavin-dependent oxidoreductase n=1 Tax=Microbacterium sp. TaxID=51671 RepID=UPI002810F327|nr:LLM class flavin-dependent oxidoreductase [Microbacterium sp.]
MTNLVFDHVASLEQLSPAEAVSAAVAAQRHGFDGTFVSDRFQPWLPTQGNASFAWTVAGALGAQTAGGVTVAAVAGYRMHAAAVAQASATTSHLFPGRHTLVLSAGNAIDEHVVGGYWPESHERMSRMLESAELIRKLFHTGARGADTRYEGRSTRMESARLWTAPQSPPQTLVWAGGPVTARRASRVADGFVASAGPSERMTALIRAARDGAREAGKTPESVTAAAYVQIAWAPEENDALRGVLTDWPMSGLQFPGGDIRSPFDVARLARHVTVDDIRARMPVTADPAVITAELRRLAGLGFRRFFVHNVLRDQRDWAAVFAAAIRPGVVDQASRGSDGEEGS